MSYELQDRVWEIDLPSSAKLVLLALAYRADASGSCYPSAPGIARLTGLNVKTVRSTLKELEKMGLLTIENRAGVTPIFTLNPTQKRVDPNMGIPKNNPTQIRVEGLPKNGQGVYPNSGTEQVNNKSITSQVVTTNFVNEDLEAPIGEQVANLHANHISAICEQQDYVLNGHEMVGMAKVNGIYLTHSPKLDDIASRGVITVQIFNHCVEKYRSSNAKGPGWLIGTLNNVSLNPKNIIEDIRKAEFAREILEDESLVDNKNKHIWDILNEEPFC